jgi:hypothetical protein
MNKAEAEKKLLEYILKNVLKGYAVMNGEGRNINNEYYCFNLKNGEQRFWTNPSGEFLKELEIND